MDSKIEEIRKKVSRTSLHIGRIPEKTKTEFIKLCEEEFEKDYGMCIKWLMDFRNGLLSSPNQILSDKIDVLAEELNQLKQMVETKPEKKTKRKMLSGKELEQVEKDEM